MRPLTDYQRRVLDYLVGYREAHGYFPTQIEQARHFGVSRSSARRARAALERRGMVAVDGGWRDLRVIQDGQLSLPGATDSQADLESTRQGVLAALACLPDEEQRVALGVLQETVARLTQGLELYGPLDLGHDRRDWVREAGEEAIDGAIYLAAARLQRLMGREH